MDRMHFFKNQAGASTSKNAIYLYDSKGQRIKKVLKSGNNRETTCYIDNVYEFHTQTKNKITKKKNLYHISDGQIRIAIIPVGQSFHNELELSTLFFVMNHVKSSNLVLNDTGSWTNIEEYTPFGETSYGSFFS